MSIEGLRSRDENGTIKERRNIQAKFMSLLAANGYSCEERAQIGCFIMRKDFVRQMFMFDVYACSSMSIANTYNQLANMGMVATYSQLSDLQALNQKVSVALDNKVKSANSNAVSNAELNRGVSSLRKTLSAVNDRIVETAEGTPEYDVLVSSTDMLGKVDSIISQSIKANAVEEKVTVSSEESILA